jgi:hypothetical protein
MGIANLPKNKWLPGVSTVLDAAAAVDKGGGLVGLPITGHAFLPGQILNIAGTVNYDADYQIISETANEVVITATYMAEVFAGIETAITGKVIILKEDFLDIEQAILAPLPRAAMPPLVWVDAATAKVEATADSPATLLLSGFPNIFNPTENITAGLSDGKSRTLAANVSCNLGAGNLWGAEKVSQWYSVLAIAGDLDPDFTLNAMPFCRVKGQTSQTISCGLNITPATGLKYGFTLDEFVGGKIYVLNGASKGLLRTITGNTENATETTITYSGTALSLAAGDWFIVLPATNFRWLGDVYNNSAGNFLWTDNLITGKFPYTFTYGASPAPYDGYWFCPLTVDQIFETGCGGGTGGASAPYYGDPAASDLNHSLSPIPGTPYAVTIGAGKAGGGSPANDGGSTSLGALRSLAGGVSGSSEVPSWPLGPYGYSSIYGANGGNGVLILERAK